MAVLKELRAFMIYKSFDRKPYIKLYVCIRMLSLKDILEINKQFSEGRVVNKSSLEYVVKTQARSKNWLRTTAAFTRAILIDHPFEDGNKRTAANVIMLLLEMNNIEFNAEKVSSVVIDITKKNLTSLREIERHINHGI